MKMKRSNPCGGDALHDVDQVIDDVIPLDRHHTGEIHVVGVEGERNDRQHEQFVRGTVSGRVTEPGDDEVVGVERQMVAVLLGGPDRLDHDRFSRRRLPQLLPGQIAPIERGTIGKLHPCHPCISVEPPAGHDLSWHRTLSGGLSVAIRLLTVLISPVFPYFGSQYERYNPSHSSLQKGSAWPSISTIQIHRGTRRPQSAQLVTAVSCQVRWISTHVTHDSRSFPGSI